jgi:pimeloyl-ACP methyl ester carboxylesterase
VTEPSLHVWTPRRPVSAVALVLHGGRSRSTVPTSRWQLSYLRMLPFDWALRRAGGRRGLAVARLRYRVRGWNGAARSPVADTTEALAALADRFPGVPVALVGHSMGGRTALHVAGDPAVRVVVLLAPWIEPGDPTAPVTGRRVLIVHGDQDTWTSPQASAEFARRVEGSAEQVSLVSVRDESHAMLRRRRFWHRITAAFVVGGLWPAVGSGRIGEKDVIGEVVAGAARVVV